MNKDDCIRILNIATLKHKSYLEGELHLWKKQQKLYPDDNEQALIVSRYELAIQDLDEALDYIEANLK